jgi:MFS family permease
MFKSAWNHLVKDYKDIPLGVKLLVWAIGLRAFGWGFADPFFSLYLNQFTQDYTLIGMFTSLVAFSALITIIPLLRLSDPMKEAIVVQDGQVLYILVVAGYIVSGLFLNIPLLICTLLLNGIAQTLIVVGTETYIRKHDGGGKSGPFGFYVALDYLGWVLGMFVAAFTVHYYSLNWMFLFILPSIFAAFILLPRLQEHGIASLFEGFRKYFHTKQDFLDLLKDFKGINPKVAFFLILAFFDGVVRMFAYVFVPLFGLSLHLDLRSIALLTVVMNVPFILSYFFSEISDSFNKMKVAAAALFIGAFAFVALHFVVGQWWLIGLSAMISFSLALLRPAYNGLISKFTPRGRSGEITGIYNLADRFGRILGPIATGLVADYFGLNATFLVIALSALGLGLISVSLRDYGKPEPAPVSVVV